jgi:hypothetical protein
MSREKPNGKTQAQNPVESSASLGASIKAFNDKRNIQAVSIVEVQLLVSRSVSRIKSHKGAIGSRDT